MQDAVNWFLKIIKYPLAMACAFFCFPILKALIQFISATFSTHLAIYFLVPVIAVVALWSLIPGLSGSALTIFGHEATHMLAAILTFHKPKGMTIEQDKGGSFTYHGQGNWLITIAPYFIPTFPLLWMLMNLFLGQKGHFENWYLIGFGIVVGFHIAANFTQIHSEQTDFKKAGWLFTILFIPGANLLLIGYLWSFALKGWTGMDIWHQYLSPSCQEFLKQVFKYIQNLF